jgi:hypothetical protein
MMPIDLHPDICESIQQLKSSDKPIVFRNGLSLMTMDEWRHFLMQDCGLIEDTRHYDTEGDMQKKNWWEISYIPEKANTYAHSSTPQPLHTDNAWFQNPAEINFFVMWKQSIKGGAQLILPISRLLESLANEQPDLLNDLTSVPVVIKKGVGQFENHTTIITKGKQPRIFWNYYRTQRTSKLIDTMCEAFFKFLGSALSSNMVDTLYCQSGDCFAFNDTLLLHGRQAFEAKLPRDRVLYQSMWRIPES